MKRKHRPTIGEAILFTVILFMLMVDLDGAHAAPVSPMYASLSAAEQDLSKFTEYKDEAGATAAHSRVCIPSIGIEGEKTWIDGQQLCLNANSRGEIGAVVSLDENLKKSKDLNITFQYNLNNGQTLNRTYKAWTDGGRSSKIILSSEQDVAEIMALSKRSPYVIVTYQDAAGYDSMLWFKLMIGRFSYTTMGWQND